MGIVRILLLVLLAALSTGQANAQTYPRPTGYVVDAADILPAGEEAALAARLQTLDQSTGTQLAVVTVPSLEGREIEDYGIGLLRAWGVGQADTDRGAILLVAPNERRVRIEVGFGLEPVLTDALTSTIIRREIIPRFRAGDLAGGTIAGADALIGHLQLPAEEQRTRAEQAQQEQAQTRERRGGINWIGIVFWLVVLGFVLLPAVIGGMRSGRRRKGPWGVRGGRRRRGGDVDWGIALWTIANIASAASRSGGGGSDGWGGGGGGGFGGFGGGSGGGGGASGSW